MKKIKSILYILAGSVIFLAVILTLWNWSSSQKTSNVPTPVASDIIFFYGQECPHCQDVEKFLADNKISDKVKFDSLEVWHNSANQKIMSDKAKECGISEDKLGVPFLYAKGQCFIGTPDVESFFKQEAGL